MNNLEDKKIVYVECLKCGGVVTKVMQPMPKGFYVSTFCRACGRTTTKLGTGKPVIQGGHGAYCIFYKDSSFQDFGAFNKGISIPLLEPEIKHILENESIDFDKTFVSLRDENGISAILGHLPPTYQQEMEKAQSEPEEKIVSTDEVGRFFEQILGKK